MTVTISSKHDIPKNDDNDNETCCSEKICGSVCDHTESLLKNLTSGVCDVQEPKMDTKKLKKHKCDVSYYEKSRKLLSYEDAPIHLKHNSFIQSGYRGMLNTKLCFESVFWWTNETINIWSHLFGFLLFFGIAAKDLLALDVYAHLGDKLIVGVVLLCFQACMLLSALYHTFSCRSAHDCDMFLSLDLFGIALSLLAIYISGIYYAFWCDQGLQNFYLITISVIFMAAMMLQIPTFQVDANVKQLVFVAWAAYGVVPTLHWTVYMGGFDNPIVALLFPRVIGMYLISGTAFFIYSTKIPERFYCGKFDYFGHSHQWWHLFVVFALYYWHSSGIMYLQYRMNHACSNHMSFM